MVDMSILQWLLYIYTYILLYTYIIHILYLMGAMLTSWSLGTWFRYASQWPLQFLRRHRPRQSKPSQSCSPEVGSSRRYTWSGRPRAWPNTELTLLRCQMLLELTKWLSDLVDLVGYIKKKHPSCKLQGVATQALTFWKHRSCGAMQKNLCIVVHFDEH